MIIHIDLPKLKSIELGYFSLFGQWGNDDCTLTMNSIHFYFYYYYQYRSS